MGMFTIRACSNRCWVMSAAASYQRPPGGPTGYRWVFPAAYELAVRRSTASAHTSGSAAPRRPHLYHPAWMGLVTVALLVALFLLALAPSRRLWLDGASLGTRVGYLLVLLAIGFAAIEVRSLARYLAPLLLALYLFPYLGLTARWRRWLGRTDVRQAGTDRPAGAVGWGGRRWRGDGRSTGGPTVIEGQALRIDGEDGGRHG